MSRPSTEVNVPVLIPYYGPEVIHSHPRSVRPIALATTRRVNRRNHLTPDPPEEISPREGMWMWARSSR